MDNNNTTTTVRPAPITRLPLYYKGRPNVVFLDRFGTAGGRNARRSA